MYHNKYDTAILNKVIKNEWKRTRMQEEQMTKKCAKFTYVGKQTRLITKLFKNSNLKISFRTENAKGKLLNVNKNINEQI